MKLILRPEWRLWPINNFLGLLDLKTGVTITLLFAVRPCHIFYFSKDQPNACDFPAIQQSSRHLRTHLCAHRRRRILCPAQSVSLLASRSDSRRMGLERSQRGPCDLSPNSQR